jgi:hypothetical protein
MNDLHRKSYGHQGHWIYTAPITSNEPKRLSSSFPDLGSGTKNDRVYKK